MKYHNHIFGARWMKLLLSSMYQNHIPEEDEKYNLDCVEKIFRIGVYQIEKFCLLDMKLFMNKEENLGSLLSMKDMVY